MFHPQKTSSQQLPSFGKGLWHPWKQGEWASTVLFFHMKELSRHKMQWTPEMESLLQFQHDSEDYYDSAEHPAFLKLVRRAFDGLVLTLVAFRKGTVNATPQLVVSTREGVQLFAPRDSRIYSHRTSRQPAQLSVSSSRSEIISEETSVYPRLVMNRASCTRPGELLVLRLVCQGPL